MNKILIMGLLASSVSLSACNETTMTGGAGLSAKPVSTSFSVVSQKTAAEKKLEDDVKSLNKVTSNIIARNTVEGALAGAAIGCGLMLLMGGDADDCARAAVVGGVAGGAYGNQVGKKTAAKNVELVKRDQMLANLKGVSTKLNGIEGELRSVLKSQDAELRSLKRQLATNQISQSAYNARLNAINSNRKAVDAGLAQSEKNMIKAQNEIKVAQQKGQKSLSGLSQATISTKNRLARNRKLISLAK